MSACGSPDSPDTALSASGVAPAGSAVTFSSNTVPTSLAPGERVNVQIALQNSGTVPWTNTAEWALFAGNSLFGWSIDFLEGSTGVGATTTNSFVITAPQASTNFVADFFSLVPGSQGSVPGSPLTIPVTINPALTRQWACSYVSDTIPVSLVAGSVNDYTVTIQNTGSQTWPGGSAFYLYAREDVDTTSPDLRRWGNGLFAFIPSAVAPLGQVTLTVRLVAPSTPGTYRLMRQVFDSRSTAAGGVGYLDVDDFCIDRTVSVVSGTLPFAATLVSETMPSTVAPGDVFSVTVRMRNTGSTTWTSAGAVDFFSRNSPTSLWGVVQTRVGSSVATNQEVDFTFTVTAPSVAGSYNFDFQMTEPTFGFFGDLVSLPVTVSAAVQAQLDASRSADTLPTTMAPGSVQAATLTMTNDGTTAWSSSDVSLVSTTVPTSLFGITSVAFPTGVTTVPAGGSVTFSFNVRAPSQVGTENFRFRMFRTGPGFFGDEVVVATNISGSVTPPLGSLVVSQTIPSTMVASSAQSFTIQMANRGTQTWPAGTTIQLASSNTPSGLWTTQQVQLPSSVAASSTVTITFSVTAPSNPGTYASRWRLFDSTVGFFGATAETTGIVVTSIPGCGDGTVGGSESCDDGNTTSGDGCSAVCQIEAVSIDVAAANGGRIFLGSQTNKNLGNVTIGRLDADSFSDVVMADYANVSRRGNAGRIYVYLGSAGFFTRTSAQVDETPNIVIEGAGASDLFGGVNGGPIVADVTGDGSADLIVPADFADGTGDLRADSGEVYIIPGSSTLYAGGTFRLATTSTVTPNPVGTVVVGAAAGDQLTLLAVGDLTDDGRPDLVLGAQFNDAGGSDAGAIYIVPGASGLAATSTIDVSSSSAWAARLVGASSGSRLGRAAAVGDLNGDGRPDLAVSALNDAASGRSRVGTVYVLLTPANGLSGTYNLSSSSSYATEIVGEANNVLYGSDLAIADVVGTATQDLVVGASQARFGSDQVGEVHVWSGPLSSGRIDNASVDATNVVFGTLRDFVGSSVAVADANGDGRVDLIVGGGLADGPSDARADAGECIVLVGGSSLSTLTAFAGSQSAAYRAFGAVSRDLMGSGSFGLSAGDVNGDGRADWCVGSPLGGDSVGGNAGRVDCFESPW